MLQSPKKTIFLYLTLFLFGIQSTNAQYYRIKERVKHLQNFDQKTLHYGYYFGFNNFGFDIKYVDNYSVPRSRYFPLNRRGQGLPDIELVKNNARLGAQISVCYNAPYLSNPWTNYLRAIISVSYLAISIVFSLMSMSY